MQRQVVSRWRLHTVQVFAPWIDAIGDACRDLISRHLGRDRNACVGEGSTAVLGEVLGGGFDQVTGDCGAEVGCINGCVSF